MSTGLLRTLRRPVGRALRVVPSPLWAAIYPAISLFVTPDGYDSGAAYEDRESAFSLIYKENRWSSPESRSGIGATVAATRTVRRNLELLLPKLQCRSLLDAPCGDFNWMRHVRLPADCAYLGRDIVPELIADLRRDYPEKDWGLLDIVAEPPPDADVWMCRAVLYHLPLADGLSVLRNMAASNVKYFMSTSHDFVRRNQDIRPGGFRYINLRAAPYNLPKPIHRIIDFVSPSAPTYLDVWTRAQVRDAVTERTG
jgi:hypothetical protein